MAVNIYGGGANTNANGLKFEQETSLSEALNAAGYVLKSNGYVYHSSSLERPIALSAPKHKLYQRILNPRGVKWREIISKQMLPDEALLNLETNTIHIIEKNFRIALDLLMKNCKLVALKIAISKTICTACSRCRIFICM